MQGDSKARVKGAYDRLSDNDFGVRLFDSTSTSQAHAIPSSWCGKMVDVYAPAEVHFGFSKDGTAAIDETAAASAAGTATSVGSLIAAGERRRVFVPRCKSGDTMYFVRASATTTNVRMELSSS